MRFEIWAPLAQTLSVLKDDGSVIDLRRDERGRFSTEQGLEPGTRYRLRVDDKGDFPNPYTHFQPEGVHGPSLVWDHEKQPSKVRPSFAGRSLEGAVIYELHVGTFTPQGTYKGAVSKLDHLVDLGVTHLELMPLSAFPGKHGWGYDGVAPFAPHQAYGTPDDLKDFIDEAHHRGLAVLIDIVFNHFGPDGNYFGLLAPFFTDHYRTPWGQAVNLDGPDSDLVRKTFVDCALFWLSAYRFDGIRLDAVHALYDQSAVHFLEQLAETVHDYARENGRTINLIAESDLNDPRFVREQSAFGYGLDAHWCDDFHHALHAFFTGENDGYYEDYGGLAAVKKALRQGYVFDGTWSPHRRRHHGRSPRGLAAHQLVVCAQNHDQVGNRARGERLSVLLSRAKLFQVAALTLLCPFVPLIFQGEEWGCKRPFLYFTDHQDPDLATSVTEGRRREFSYFAAHHGVVPDPQAQSSYQDSVLDWSDLDRDDHRQVHAWYKRLLALRTLLGPLDEVEVDIAEDERWLRYQSGQVELFLNFSNEPVSVSGFERSGEVLARFQEQPSAPSSGAEETASGREDQLPPQSALVCKRRQPT